MFTALRSYLFPEGSQVIQKSNSSENTVNFLSTLYTLK